MRERERNGAGVGNVEALDRAWQIEAGHPVAALARQPSQTPVLRAEDQRQRTRERLFGRAGPRASESSPIRQ